MTEKGVGVAGVGVFVVAGLLVLVAVVVVVVAGGVAGEVVAAFVLEKEIGVIAGGGVTAAGVSVIAGVVVAGGVAGEVVAVFVLEKEIGVIAGGGVTAAGVSVIAGVVVSGILAGVIVEGVVVVAIGMLGIVEVLKGSGVLEAGNTVELVVWGANEALVCMVDVVFVAEIVPKLVGIDPGSIEVELDDDNEDNVLVLDVIFEGVVIDDEAAFGMEDVEFVNIEGKVLVLPDPLFDPKGLFVFIEEVLEDPPNEELFELEALLKGLLRRINNRSLLHLRNTRRYANNHTI